MILGILTACVTSRHSAAKYSKYLIIIRGNRLTTNWNYNLIVFNASDRFRLCLQRKINSGLNFTIIDGAVLWSMECFLAEVVAWIMRFVIKGLVSIFQNICKTANLFLKVELKIYRFFRICLCLFWCITCRKFWSTVFLQFFNHILTVLKTFINMERYLDTWEKFWCHIFLIFMI